jgi:hypothetical protein
MIFQSTDGAAWTASPSGISYGLSKVTFGQGRFIAVGWQENILSSTDGLRWTKETKGVDEWISASACSSRFPDGSGAILAVGASPAGFLAATCDGRLLFSETGIIWSLVRLPPGGALRDVVYGDGEFIAVGLGGVIIGTRRSSDPVPSPDADKSTLVADRLSAPADGETPITFTLTLRDRGGRAVAHRLVSLQFMPKRSPGEEIVGDGDYGIEGLSDWDGTMFVRLRDKNIGEVTLSAYVLPESRTNSAGVSITQTITVGFFPVTTEPAPCTGVFKDLTENHPACSAVEFLHNRKVIGGYQDGTFQPDKGITRAEFAKMLVMAMGQKPNTDARLPFSDAQGHWAATMGYIQTAINMKVIQGFPDGSFRPDAPLTRAQVVKIAAAAGSLVPTGKPVYRDVETTDWFAGWVVAAEVNGLIGAKAPLPIWTEATFDGNRPSTRAEAAMVLSNLVRR